ncbi:eukaryotic translation initiation factor 5B-like [Lotus japonicus]|uniref:eukaryotic translation initiation factor 5B-like n=1 Tax=Lotus japonicus TaxID=34305 RepID=UPI0025898752|nr:eukaryotic translation initiation factor 5B-like [Lotus japonicus]
METRRRRRSETLEQRRSSPPRRVRGRPRREEVSREQPEQPTPPPPPPPPSLTPPLPSPPSSPSQQGSPARLSEVSGGGSSLPQAPITHRNWRRLIRNVNNIRQRNDYLQEQLDYYRLKQQDEGEREAEPVAEFKPFSAAVRELERETLKQNVKRYSAASVKIEELEPQACARAFKNGRLPGKMNNKLSRKPARSMAEVRARANTYILDEEDDAFKRRRAKVEKDGGQRNVSPTGRQGQEKGENSNRSDKKVKQPEKFEKEQLYPKKENFERRRPWQQTHPRRRERPGGDMNTELTELLREVKATHAFEEGEKEVNPPREAVDKTKWCEYHRRQATTPVTVLRYKARPRG